MIFFTKYIKRFQHQVKKGFSFVEMLVVIAIFGMVAAVVLTSGSKFNGTILLTNLAYDMALSVRQAQVYGINVRETANSSGIFKTNYGVRFLRGANVVCTNTTDTLYFLFADTNQDHRYTAGVDPAPIQNFCLTQGNTISSICTVASGAGNSCVTVPGSPLSGILDITFTRPDPNACLNRNVVVGAQPPARLSGGLPISTDVCTQATGISSAEVTIRSSQGTTRKIVIQSTGQISIQ